MFVNFIIDVCICYIGTYESARAASIVGENDSHLESENGEMGRKRKVIRNKRLLSDDEDERRSAIPRLVKSNNDRTSSRIVCESDTENEATGDPTPPVLKLHSRYTEAAVSSFRESAERSNSAMSAVEEATTGTNFGSPSPDQGSPACSSGSVSPTLSGGTRTKKKYFCGNDASPRLIGTSRSSLPVKSLTKSSTAGTIFGSQSDMHGHLERPEPSSGSMPLPSGSCGNRSNQYCQRNIASTGCSSLPVTTLTKSSTSGTIFGSQWDLHGRSERPEPSPGSVPPPASYGNRSNQYSHGNIASTSQSSLQVTSLGQPLTQRKS